MTNTDMKEIEIYLEEISNNDISIDYISVSKIFKKLDQNLEIFKSNTVQTEYGNQTYLIQEILFDNSTYLILKENDQFSGYVLVYKNNATIKFSEKLSERCMNFDKAKFVSTLLDLGYQIELSSRELTERRMWIRLLLEEKLVDKYKLYYENNAINPEILISDYFNKNLTVILSI